MKLPWCVAAVHEQAMGIEYSKAFLVLPIDMT